MPCVWLTPPPTHTKWMEMEGGVQLKKLNSLLREHQLWRGTAIPPTSKKMEPRSYFNIKNALNGFTYNLVPKDHYEMQSLCIISVSVINIGARVGLQFFRMSPIKMIFFLLHFVNSLTPPHTPWPPKSQIYRKKNRTEEKWRKSWDTFRHHSEVTDSLLKSKKKNRTYKFWVTTSQKEGEKLKHSINSEWKHFRVFPEAKFPKQMVRVSKKGNIPQPPQPEKSNFELVSKLGGAW